MHAPRKIRRRHPRERGFTLVELGVVIGVISILISLAVVGQGFVQSTRLSKVVQAVDSLKKGARTWGGLGQARFPNGRNIVAELYSRGIVHASPGEIQPGFSIHRGDTAGSHYAIEVQCPAGSCADLWQTSAEDNTMFQAGNISVGAMQCTTSSPDDNATRIVLCFDILGNS